jgi:CheY-like chemotaxis protein
VSVDLEAALALARKHSEAKDRFLAVVSHELRTPLHGILGLNKLTRADLPKNSGSSLTHYRLELMEDAGLHLQRMVNDLLDISFMESGKLQLVPQPFNLRQELDSIAATYGARAPEVGIGFVAYIQPSLAGLVVGDKGRLAQVLHNLLGNAFKFTPLGGSVSLSVERLHGTDTIQFLVRDSGPGVAESEQEAIFDPFTQGSFAGSRPEGVGLGLAISRQLARAMLGDVVCRPVVPSGSEFTFTAVLPVYVPALGDRPLPSDVAKPRSSVAGLTVYVADDDSLNALIHGSVVRSMGCELETFGDGQQLVERVLNASASPAAIVLDWDMPVLDGRAATLAIRRHEQASGSRPVPIIGLSANSLPSYRVAGLEAGMTLFLTKPCAPQVLVDALKSVLERQPPARVTSTFDQRHSTAK